MKILLAFLSGAASIIVIAVVTMPDPEEQELPSAHSLSPMRWPSHA